MRLLKRLSLAAAALTLVAGSATAAVTVDRATASTPAPAPVSQVQVQQDRDHLELEEGEPGWDCRFDGNKKCGVFFEGQWQLISYDTAGNPVNVQPRGL